MLLWYKGKKATQKTKNNLWTKYLLIPFFLTDHIILFTIIYLFFFFCDYLKAIHPYLSKLEPLLPTLLDIALNCSDSHSRGYSCFVLAGLINRLEHRKYISGFGDFIFIFIFMYFYVFFLYLFYFIYFNIYFSSGFLCSIIRG